MICGLLGKNIAHSHSPKIHGKIGEYEYLLIDRESAEEALAFIEENDEFAINITSPYKEIAFSACDHHSEIARRIGAVNVVLKRDGEIYGDNTDYYGFNTALAMGGNRPTGKKVVIFGSGGAGKAAALAAIDAGAKSVKIMSRDPASCGEIRFESDAFGIVGYDDERASAEAEIIINATPAEKDGQTSAPVEMVNFPNCRFVFDLNYNPLKSELLLNAKEMGIKTENGLTMLVAQAYKSAMLFGKIHNFSRSNVENTAAELLKSLRNIVLIGMGGVGKTTTARALSKRTGIEFIDSDQRVCDIYGEYPNRIISEQGEKEYRRIEAEVLKGLLSERGKIISLGGGAVVHQGLMREFSKNATMVFMDEELEKLSRHNRPLYTDDVEVERIYEQRIKLYRKFSDIQLYAGMNRWRILERLEKL